MKNQEERSLKVAKRKEKSVTEEAERLVKEKVRKKAYLAREQAIEKVQKEKKAKRTDKRDNEEIEQLAKDKARKEVYFAREIVNTEAQEARKIKAKTQLLE